MNKKNIVIIAAVLLLVINGALLFSFLQKDRGDDTEEEGIVYGDVLNIYNWEDYLSEELIGDFEELYGITVNLDYFEDSDDIVVSLQGDPEKYDIVIADNDYVEYFARLRLLENIDHGKIPNITNINRDVIRGSFDEDMYYCAPYVPGYTGIAINPNYIENYEGDNGIFWNQEYRGKITMPVSSTEILVIAAYYLGYEPNNMTPEELEEAEKKAIELRDMDILFGDPVQQREWLVSGEAWIGYTYSTEVIFIQEENEDIEFFAPTKGTHLWHDSMCIPKDAQNKEGAHLFINYLFDIENMAKNSEDIYAMMPGRNIENYMDVDIVEDLKGLDFPEDREIMDKSTYTNYYLIDEVQEVLGNISRELNIRE